MLGLLRVWGWGGRTCTSSDCFARCVGAAAGSAAGALTGFDGAAASSSGSCSSSLPSAAAAAATLLPASWKGRAAAQSSKSQQKRRQQDQASLLTVGCKHSMAAMVECAGKGWLVGVQYLFAWVTLRYCCDRLL
mgnify:CR=1 FL=1